MTKRSVVASSSVSEAAAATFHLVVPHTCKHNVPHDAPQRGADVFQKNSGRRCHVDERKGFSNSIPFYDTQMWADIRSHHTTTVPGMHSVRMYVCMYVICMDGIYIAFLDVPYVPCIPLSS